MPASAPSDDTAMSPAEQERGKTEREMRFGDACGEHEDDRPASFVAVAPVSIRERQARAP